MIKANRLNKGDKVAIVSLSSGILGEKFVVHELNLAVKRLEELGLEPVFMPNSLKGLDFIKNNPEARANDLKQAFADPEIKAIICAIGGEDTYKTLPYLLSDETFKSSVKNNPKIFLGFSDTTTNHMMLYGFGLTTFYGQALLTDIAEFEPEMLPYSKEAFDRLFAPTETTEILPSKVWYEDRKDYSPDAVGTLRVSHDNSKGYELLNGTGKVQGELLGGCIEVLGDFVGMGDTTNETLNYVSENYNIFPSNEVWKGKIMFLETSEQKMTPDNYKKVIRRFKELGVFNQINGLLIGKPIDEVYYEEYKQVLSSELADFNFPILYNINIGHAYPHTILPLGVLAEIDCSNKSLTLLESPLN